VSEPNSANLPPECRQTLTRRCSSAAASTTGTPSKPEMSPLELIVRAARIASESPGTGRLLERTESVRIVDCLSRPVPDPGALVAEALGIRPAETLRTLTSGTGPLDLLADAAAEIQAGRLDVAACWRRSTTTRGSRTRCAAAGRTPEEHQEWLGRLWHRFAEVAESNPDAWTREAPALRRSPRPARTTGWSPSPARS
jgi:acetyl-CoA C-acetyltransferase